MLLLVVSRRQEPHGAGLSMKDGENDRKRLRPEHRPISRAGYM